MCDARLTRWLCYPTFLFVIHWRAVLTLALCACGGIGSAAELSKSDALYLNVIKPLLNEKCVSCHGPLKAESGLRLDALQLIKLGGDSGEVISAGEPDDSELLFRVTSDDVSMRMPPQHEGSPLTEAERNAFRRWLQAGAPGPESEEYLSSPLEHWAFRPIDRPVLAPAEGSPIDALIAQAQAESDLVPLPPADENTWLRRVTLDLIGLPPTLAELKNWQADRTPDRKRKVVDRLLSSPQFGQRWGRHWMDVWRYSDWDGYKQELRGSQRHIWHWRDWIVASLNANKPYDQMIHEMLAGDEIAPTEPDVLRATGFLARNFHKSNRDIWLDATVEHTAKAFLGLTLNCARCHDHKYDPISQRDYYQFRAIFEPHRVRADQVAGVSDIAQDGIPRAYDADLEAATYIYRRGDEKQPIKDDPVQAGVLEWIPGEFEPHAIELPLSSYVPDLSETHRQNRLSDKQQAVTKTLTEIQQVLEKYPLAETDLTVDQLSAAAAAESQVAILALKLRVAMADQQSLIARYNADVHSFQGGDANSLKTLASRAAEAEHRHQRLAAELLVLEKQQQLSVVRKSTEKDAAKRKAAIAAARKAVDEAQQALEKIAPELAPDSVQYTSVGEVLPASSSGRRLALARWITNSQNPLTARVAVNHLWMRHMGQPLVENVFDFGINSPSPQLIEVLDWLAAELMASGWNLKHLHRLIILSDAYGRSSSSNSPRHARNSSIDPENGLHWHYASRRLDAEQIRDSLLAVAGTLDVSFSGPDIDYTLGETVTRRSLYFRHAYEKQMQMMVLFDAASPNECYRRRPSVIPQQALVMFNSALARTAARQLATRICPTPERLSSEDYIQQLYEYTLSRKPTQEELRTCVAYLEKLSESLAEPDTLALFESPEQTQVSASSDPRQRARESLALVLLNHNDFLSLR